MKYAATRMAFVVAIAMVIGTSQAPRSNFEVTTVAIVKTISVVKIVKRTLNGITCTWE